MKVVLCTHHRVVVMNIFVRSATWKEGYVSDSCTPIRSRRCGASGLSKSACWKSWRGYMHHNGVLPCGLCATCLAGAKSDRTVPGTSKRHQLRIETHGKKVSPRNNSSHILDACHDIFNRGPSYEIFAVQVTRLPVSRRFWFLRESSCVAEGVRLAQQRRSTVNSR